MSEDDLMRKVCRDGACVLSSHQVSVGTCDVAVKEKFNKYV